MHRGPDLGHNEEVNIVENVNTIYNEVHPNCLGRYVFLIENGATADADVLGDCANNH